MGSFNRGPRQKSRFGVVSSLRSSRLGEKSTGGEIELRGYSSIGCKAAGLSLLQR